MGGIPPLSGKSEIQSLICAVNHALVALLRSETSGVGGGGVEAGSVGTVVGGRTVQRNGSVGDTALRFDSLYAFGFATFAPVAAIPLRVEHLLGNRSWPPRHLWLAGRPLKRRVRRTAPYPLTRLFCTFLRPIL